MALRPQIDAALAMSAVALPGLSNLEGVLPQWATIVEQLDNYQKMPNRDDKVRFLGNAVSSLSQLEREVRSTRQEPDRSILGESATRWLDTVNNTMEDVRGRAELGFTMLTRNILALEDARVALEIHNEGSEDAENVKVELLPSKQFEFVGGDGMIAGSIPPTQSRSIEFRIRPLVAESFLAEFHITFDDQRRKGRTGSFSDRVSLVSVSEEFKPIPNPYQAGRPLPQGSPLFFGREDVFAFIASNLGGPSLDSVLVLIGQRRCGKTSMLKQLPLKLDKRYLPVYIDGQQLGIDPGMANLFYGLSSVIASSLTEAGIVVASPARTDFEPAPSQVFEQEFLAQVEQALGGRRLLLAFDEFEEIESRVRESKLEPTIFPFLRHLMQHSDKLSFIFVGTHKLDELSKDYWSIFFNIAQHRQIRFLDDTAARCLIVDPVAESGLIYDDLAVKRILDITACHPYFVQLVCHALVNHANATKRSYITGEDVRNAVNEVIALGEAHFGWLWNLASPREQLVLATLTELLRDETMVTSSTISILLDRQRIRMDPAEVSDIMSRLVAQDIVQEIPDHVLQYRFKLDIVSLWIRRNKPLSRVIEDQTVRVPFREGQTAEAQASQ